LTITREILSATIIKELLFRPNIPQKIHVIFFIYYLAKERSLF